MEKTVKDNLDYTSNIDIFAGGFGSGKSEIALNYAVDKAKYSKDLVLSDLDLVNPYFVSRDLKIMLEENGITLSAPRGEFTFGDVPHIPSEIISILNQDRNIIIDVAGDEVGSLILGYLNKYIKARPYNFYLVLNPYRPFAQDAESIIELKETLENASKLKFTGIISNPNLVEETNLETIINGHKKVEEFAKILELPVNFITVGKQFYNDVVKYYGSVVKEIKLYLRPNIL
ncbi:hypothetical protein SYNTR_1283 [Candidatus Syntrophocurvum alkaliphilum]|uniref:CobQ/CobB/MinD/ParA nucleotide binding domain-containing protein n=1 Tax=Candidatus Syntrophocurvum alkaliphilum TaxID=2293317 RepID=A0A6I6DFE6_9FIRM|nr:hypothetical protein [Candidatus Syntrophocurvum alkaliphilum]QGT99876.1 hypothetical protein SYNTR_1283 [Candidatus Syntrophocurvum alkaliphilum]